MRASSTCAVRLGAMLGIALLLLLSAKRRSAAQLTNASLLTPSAKHGSLRSLAAPQRCAPPSLAGITHERLDVSLWPWALRRTSRRRI